MPATICCFHYGVEMCCACAVLLQEVQEQESNHVCFVYFRRLFDKNKSYQTASCDCVLRLDETSSSISGAMNNAKKKRIKCLLLCILK